MTNVTPSTLFNIVHNISSERLLLPLLSESCLLWILERIISTSEDEFYLSTTLQVEECINQIIKKANDIIYQTQKHVEASQPQDWLFINGMKKHCANLRQAVSELAEIKHCLQNTFELNVNWGISEAATNVCLAVWKIFCVYEELTLKKVTSAIEKIKETLVKIQKLSSQKEYLNSIESLEQSKVILVHVCEDYYTDLLDISLKETIVQALFKIKKLVSRLVTILETEWTENEYAWNKTETEEKITELHSSLSQLDVLVNYPSTVYYKQKFPRPGSFITNIEQMLKVCSENGHCSAVSDVEVWMGRIIEHSLKVASHCYICQPDYRHLILDNCRRLMQANRRAVELSDILSDSISSSKMRNDLTDIWEIVKDELLELEENVNLALVGVIVDVFTETTEPLENLMEAIVLSHQDKNCKVADFLVKRFFHHSSQICEIAELVAACISDAEAIKQIEFVVHGLKKFKTEATAMVKHAHKQKDTDITDHVKTVVQGWSLHLIHLLNILYDITEPQVFLEMTGKTVHDDICLTYTNLLHCDQMLTARCMQRVICHSKQYSQCARQIINNSTDAVFRSHFQHYVNELNTAINSLQDVSYYLSPDFCNPRYREIIEKQLNNLHKAIKDVHSNVSQGISSDMLHSVKNLDSKIIEVNKSASTCVPHWLQNNISVKAEEKLRCSETSELNQPADEANLNTQLTSFSIEDRILSPVNSTCISPSSCNTSHHSLAFPLSPVGSPKQDLVEKLGEPLPIETCLTESGNEQTTVPSSLDFILSIQNTEMTSGVSTHLQTVFKNIVKASKMSDRNELNLQVSSLHQWASHISECAQTLMHHGNVETKRSKLEKLCTEIDCLSARIINTIKQEFQIDGPAQQKFFSDCKVWCIMLDKVCLIIDKTVVEWKQCSELVQETVDKKEQDLLTSQIEIFESQQQAMTDLLSRISSFSLSEDWNCQPEVSFLKQTKLNLLDITDKIKTMLTSEPESESSCYVYKDKLRQLCCKWAVNMYCSQCGLERISDQILSLEGCKMLGKDWNEVISDEEKLIEKMDEEASAIGGLLDCVSIGNDEKKTRSFQLVSEISAIMDEIKACIQEISTQPNVQRVLLLRKKVLMGQWIIKLRSGREFVKEECRDFIEILDKFELKASDLFFICVDRSTDGHDSSSEQDLSALRADLKTLNNNVLIVEKKVLVAIKLSTNLVKRDLIGRYVKELTSMTSELVSRMDSLATGTDNEGQSSELYQLKLQWAANIKRLILTLENMTDVRKSLVPEIKKLISSCLIRLTERSEKVKSEIKSTSVNKKENRSSHQSKGENSSDKDNNKQCEQRLSDGEKTKILKLSKSEETGRIFKDSFEENENLLLVRRFGHLYRDPDYQPWADDNNDVVKTAKKIAEDLCDTELFCRCGQFDTDGINRLFEKVESIAENGLRMERYFKVLTDYCEKSLSCELLKRTELIDTYASQLQVILNGLKNSSKTAQTVLMLLHNSNNLVEAVLDTFTTAEMICVKGFQKPIPDAYSEEDSIIDLMNQWQEVLQKYRTNENLCASTDELGLRRVDHKPWPSLTDIFKKN